MKKLLLFGSLALCMSTFGQNAARQPKPATFSPGISHNGSTSRIAGGHNQVNNLTCTDTLRYSLNKQAALFGANWQNNFNTFNCWRADNEAIAQTFHQSGGSVTINKVEFYGNNDATNGTTSVTVQAAVYNVNGSGVPTTMIGSGTSVITSTVAAYQYVALSVPVTVTGDYAIVLTPTNTNGVLEYFVTSATPGETMDGENLTHYKSGYYPNSGGTYITIPALTTGDATNFPTGPYDFEPLVAPIVSYGLTSSLSATPNPVCQGTAVTVNSSVGPAGVLSSPMYTFGAFLNHFNLQPDDSTYAWDMDGVSPLVWNTNPSYTYSTAGTYTATMYVLGGFSHSCLDQATTTITVQAPPTANFTYASPTYCTGGTNPSPTLGTSTAGTFSALPAGMNFVSASTGVINLGTTTAGTYTVTNSVAASGGCPSANGSFTVTVNQTPTVNSITSQTVCANAATSAITLTGSMGGAAMYTWTNSDASTGLAANGMGDISSFTATNTGSTPVTSNVSVTPSAGGCIGTATSFSIVVNPMPVMSTVSNQTYCNGDAAPLTALTSNVSGSAISWTNGDPSIGLAASGNGDVPAFTATNSGSSTVTASVTASVMANGCAGTPTTYTITVNPSPAVSFTTLPSSVCVNASDFALTGATPAGGNYSGTGVSAGMFSPATAGAGTYNVTYSYTDGNGCSGSAMASIMVDPCIGLKDVSDAGTIALYPNPAKNQVTFTLTSNTDKADVSICTVEGKVVYQGHFSGNKGTIDVSSFARGMYFVRVKAENKESISKLMID